MAHGSGGGGGGGGGGGTRFRQTVHVHGPDDQARAHGEDQVHVEAEEVDGHDGGDHDGEGGGEALQDVVGVLHHHGHQEAAEGLVQDHAPHHGRVAEQEALLGDGGAIIPPQAQQAQHRAKDAQLHVPQPHRRRTALQDLLEVDAGEARRQARHDHRHQALGVALAVIGCHGLLLLAALLLHLDDGHAPEQQQQRHPLHARQALPQHQHGEEGRGQDLQLIRHLEAKFTFIKYYRQAEMNCVRKTRKEARRREQTE